MNLREYALALHKALRWNKPFVGYDKDIGHAHVIVSLAFAHAKKTILLLSNRLDPDVVRGGRLSRRGEELPREARNRTRVLVESEIDPQHKLLDLLRKRRDKVTVKHVPSDV